VKGGRRGGGVSQFFAWLLGAAGSRRKQLLARGEIQYGGVHLLLFPRERRASAVDWWVVLSGGGVGRAFGLIVLLVALVVLGW
jgi:hypothetical protein